MIQHIKWHVYHSRVKGHYLQAWTWALSEYSETSYHPFLPLSLTWKVRVQLTGVAQFLWTPTKSALAPQYRLPITVHGSEIAISMRLPIDRLSDYVVLVVLVVSYSFALLNICLLGHHVKPNGYVSLSCRPTVKQCWYLECWLAAIMYLYLLV